MSNSIHMFIKYPSLSPVVYFSQKFPPLLSPGVHQYWFSNEDPEERRGRGQRTEEGREAQRPSTGRPVWVEARALLTQVFFQPGSLCDSQALEAWGCCLRVYTFQ